MTDPKTAAILQGITEAIRPVRFEIAHSLDENDTLEFTVRVQATNGGTDSFTFHLDVNDAFGLAERLVLPFARKML